MFNIIIALLAMVAFHYVLEKDWVKADIFKKPWVRAVIYVLIFAIGTFVTPQIENLVTRKHESQGSISAENSTGVDSEDIDGTDSTDALAEDVKAETLEEAENFAESGDYASAIALIKNAQETNGEDADYTSAYNTYHALYKAEVIRTANELSDNGDYLGAFKHITEALAVIGEDSELASKSQEYENAYVFDVIAQAEELLAVKDYDGADELVNTAKKQFRNNSALNDETQRIASVKPISSKDIMQILSTSVLSESGTYKAYLGSDSINAFAEDQHNAFSVTTQASYNMWGNEVQNVSFKISSFTFDTLSFTICGETGSSGSVTIDVYLDHSVEDGIPDYSFNLDDAPYPVNAVIDVSGKTTLAFKVTNHAGHENRIVFYGFEGS